MAFETKQMKTVSPVYDEDDMISKENLPYLMDDFLQLLEIEQSENNFTVIIYFLYYESILSKTIVPMLSRFMLSEGCK